MLKRPVVGNGTKRKSVRRGKDRKVFSGTASTSHGLNQAGSVSRGGIRL